MSELTINKSTGLENCAGLEDLYNEVLQDYKQDAVERQANLRKFKEAKDWHNYAIEAHSVKSTSYTIGATEFGDHAKKHEFAGKEENEAYIMEDFDAFMATYDELLASI